MNLETSEWKYDPEKNRITALDNGNCRTTIVEGIYGRTVEERNKHGKLIALSPLLLDLLEEVLSSFTVWTPKNIVELSSSLADMVKE